MLFPRLDGPQPTDLHVLTGVLLLPQAAVHTRVQVSCGCASGYILGRRDSVCSSVGSPERSQGLLVGMEMFWSRRGLAVPGSPRIRAACTLPGHIPWQMNSISMKLFSFKTAAALVDGESAAGDGALSWSSPSSSGKGTRQRADGEAGPGPVPRGREWSGRNQCW